MADRVDVKSWLAVNKLGYVEKTFIERNIAIEELMDFDTEELKDFAKDLKLDALATRRFVKAIEDQKAYFKSGKIVKLSNQDVGVSMSEGPSSLGQNIKPLSMVKSVSDGSDGVVAAPAENSVGGSEDVAPPEAAFGMPLQFVGVNPMEGINHEGNDGEGEGGGEGGEPVARLDSVIEDVPIVNQPSVIEVVPKFTPKVEYQPVSVPRQSSAELKIKGGIQGKDDKVHIIVTPMEQEAVNKLNDRLSVVVNLIDGIETSFDSLDNCGEKIKDQIREKIDLVVNTLKGKQEAAQTEAKKLQDTKNTALKSQLKTLTDHQSAITAAKQRYEELIADPKKDVHERRLDILTMCNSILNDRNISLAMATAADVKFGFHMDSVKQFCRKLSIDDCDQPSPPMQFTGDDVSSESVKLRWKMFEFADTKPVLEYGIEVSVLPDTERAAEKSTLITPNDKKKSKKRKSSDDESESEEESSEESSSESESSRGKGKKKRKNGKKGSKDKEDEGGSKAVVENDPDKVEMRPSVLLSKYPDLQWKQITSLKLAGKKGQKLLKKLKEKDSEKDKDKDKEKDKEKESGRYFYVLNGLKEYTPYLIRIRAQNESGWSHYSQCIRVQTKKVEIKSKILKPEDKKILVEWLPKKERQYSWQLLYQASKSQYSAYVFHQKCDNKKGPTMVVVKTTMGHVFGGYTTVPWTSSGSYGVDPKAFIFKLREPKMNTKKWKKNLKLQQKTFGKTWKIPGKFDCHTSTSSVNHNSSYGPTFGGGHDFYLCNSCNTTNSSYANSGSSYSCPRSNAFLAGTYNFMVKEYEVFLLKKPKRK